MDASCNANKLNNNIKIGVEAEKLVPFLLQECLIHVLNHYQSKNCNLFSSCFVLLAFDS